MNKESCYVSFENRLQPTLFHKAGTEKIMNKNFIKRVSD